MEGSNRVRTSRGAPDEHPVAFKERVGLVWGEGIFVHVLVGLDGCAHRQLADSPQLNTIRPDQFAKAEECVKPRQEDGSEKEVVVGGGVAKGGNCACEIVPRERAFANDRLATETLETAHRSGDKRCGASRADSREKGFKFAAYAGNDDIDRGGSRVLCERSSVDTERSVE